MVQGHWVCETDSIVLGLMNNHTILEGRTIRHGHRDPAPSVVEKQICLVVDCLPQATALANPVKSDGKLLKSVMFGTWLLVIIWNGALIPMKNQKYF